MSEPLYYGARVVLSPGHEVPPRGGFISFTPNLDAAIWAAELADGDDEPRVYRVAVTGSTENAEQRPARPALRPLPHNPQPRKTTAGKLHMVQRVSTAPGAYRMGSRERVQ